MKRPIYLDHNATSPIAPEVLEAMMPFLQEHHGNPSSAHPYGRTAAAAVDKARAQMARLLGCEPDEVLFTSGGTESDNLALLGVAQRAPARHRHIITSAVEHPAVVEPLRHLERNGWKVTWLPVDHDGRVSAAQVERAVKQSTALVTVMLANNETGALQPVHEMAAACRARGAVLHTDAAQAVGKIPVNVDELGVDLLTVAGHKFYAPKGVGALYVRRGTKLAAQILGAPHEAGLRSGTENVASLVGLGAAAELARRELPGRAEHLRSLRDRLHRGLAERFPELQLNGPVEERLPNTLNVSLPGIPALALLDRLVGVAAGAGAACHAGDDKPSGVLTAMGLPAERALAALRLTVGRPTTIEEVDQAMAEIADAVRAHQEQSARPDGAPVKKKD
jgi:cysteine desulfurase